MRISWLSADEIAAAREALTAGGRSWDDHFPSGQFAGVPPPAGHLIEDWTHVTEHVARAERVSQIVRDFGFEEAVARFGASGIAIEAATLAAAAHEGSVLDFDRVSGVLRCPIDSLVFYAPFLELMVELGKDRVDRTVALYEEFVDAYAESAVADAPRGLERIGAARDGLADFYVSVGRFDEAEALFEKRHDEDRGDVAVALSASRAFLAAGSVSHAVRWLGVGAERATRLGRSDLAIKLIQKQERVRERLS
ncbi:MAG: hypothetical protein H0V17_15400 [Deltaproteobacteria bacterium]|nr:hypothetical protein [Deltaproteobacteria bacterium]